MSALRFTVAADRCLEITPEVVALLRSYAQHDPEALEAGGLLLGRLSEGNHLLTIERVTEPLPGDVRTRRTFERNDPGHGLSCQRAWEASGGQVACWGDWHTHAEPRPTPSADDMESWRADAARADCSFALIVGTEEIRVWEVRRDGAVRRLEPAFLECVSCDETVPAAEASERGWRSQTDTDGEPAARCPECQKSLEGPEGWP